MLTGEGLFDEKGRSALSNGESAELLGSFSSGSYENIIARYKNLIAKLGVLGTEMGRARDLEGFGTHATILSATHSFIFPPQDALVLRSRGDDGELRHDGLDRELTHELKLGGVEGYIALNIGVALDTDQDPLTLEVYDLKVSQEGSITEELAQSIETTIQEATAEKRRL
jgi:hypothetical protein